MVYSESPVKGIFGEVCVMGMGEGVGTPCRIDFWVYERTMKPVVGVVSWDSSRIAGGSQTDSNSPQLQIV